MNVKSEGLGLSCQILAVSVKVEDKDERCDSCQTIANVTKIDLKSLEHTWCIELERDESEEPLELDPEMPMKLIGLATNLASTGAMDARCYHL